MRYEFLIDTYATERIKVLSTWSMFHDANLHARPHPADARGRNALEHMVHQCMSEDGWFKDMLGIDVSAPPLPSVESRLGFIRRYAGDSLQRLERLKCQADEWWEEDTRFFDVPRSRAWVVVRRVAHTAHHRGQQTALLRMLGRDLHSNYGPTADTGGLARNGGRTVYAYPDLDALLGDGVKAVLPGTGAKPPTERP
jgi:uncharacterized damage-inducible protein DinB